MTNFSNEGKEITELSLQNSTVLSYQHFQDHLEALPSTEIQAYNVHADEPTPSRLQRADERGRITKVHENSSIIKHDALDNLKCPTKISKAEISKICAPNTHDASNGHWCNTSTYTNDFVTTREREKTGEEEMYDPLQIIIPSVKVEPSNAGDSDVRVPADDEIELASDFVAVEMKTIKQSNSIASDCDEISDENSKVNLKLEKVLPQANEIEPLSVMDIKVEIEEFISIPLQNRHNSKSAACLSINIPAKMTDQRVRRNTGNRKFINGPRIYKRRQGTNMEHLKAHFDRRKTEINKKSKIFHLTRSKAKLNETQIKSETDELIGNPLHSYHSSSSCDEEAGPSPETLEKRKFRFELARINKERRKIKVMERKEKFRKNLELVRSKRCTLHEDFLQEDEKEIEISRLTRSKANIDENQDIGRKKYFADDDDSDSYLYEKRKRLAAKMRERRARETPQETEARRLKARINKMKSRLVAQLVISESELKEENARKAEEMRLMRQNRREIETPEQTAARKLRQSLQARWSRNRLEAVETPEETAKRKAVRAAYLKKRNEAKKAKETQEEKALRKVQRNTQRRGKIQLQKLGSKAKDTECDVSVTSNIRAVATQPNSIINDSTTLLNNNNLTESVSNITFNNL